MSSYAGNLLRVNLSGRTTSTEKIPVRIQKSFIGARGFGIKYLYDELKPGIEPLGPENKLLLLAGPLGGTKGQGFSKMIVMAKSPLTGCIARSCGGGAFGVHLKFAGFDFIIVEGASPEPAYVYIEQGKIEILSAKDLWGLDTQQAQEILKERHGPNTKVACIGPAGEKLVRFAAVVSDRRTAARCGVGTVMGSKNLKAIVVNATGQLVAADAKRYDQLVKKQIAYLKNLPFRQEISDYGTNAGLEHFYNSGFYPVRNYQEGRLKGVEQLYKDQYAKDKIGSYGCYSCMTRCGQLRRVSSGVYKGAFSEGPEYETAYALGGEIGNIDRGFIVAADAQCDLLGMDTISCGVAMGFACELYQRSILTPKDTDGLELTWGNHAAMLTLVKKIGQREGFGWLLGEGVKRAAVQIGKGAEHYAMHVKGLEFPGYEPRALKGFAVNYATSNLGACHQYGYYVPEVRGLVDQFTEEGKAVAIAEMQRNSAIDDSIVVCNFGNPELSPELRGHMLVAATGHEEFGDIRYVNKVGERIVCLERAFNVREGFDRKDDCLPARILNEPLENARPSTGNRVQNQDKLLDEYYEALGYTKQGIPSAPKLQELELAHVIKDMEKHY